MGSEIAASPVPKSVASDDEILGLSTHLPRRAKDSRTTNSARPAKELAGGNSGLDVDLIEVIPADGSDEVAQNRGADGSTPAKSTQDLETTPENSTEQDEPAALREIFAANPELRDDWRDAKEYREVFATPAEARAATALIGDLNRMDALFFSNRPQDHAELARAVAQLDPAAFASLARQMAELAPGVVQAKRETQRDAQDSGPNNPQPTATSTAAIPAQSEFFHSTNAAAVQSVLNAIETQVEKLLPEGIAKSARNRVVAEIYREIDATLSGNRALGQQIREAFRSGALDEAHRRAIVSLVTGRARQALPGVAKRVLDEWTTTVVSANHARRARQRTAERRVDIAGSGGAGNEGRRGISSRDIDYARMSDADILNL
jgi:hypothetical protein